MVYVFGVLGFIAGFILGVFLIGLFLRRRDKAELMENKSLRWTWGVLVWAIAALTSWSAVQAYYEYFL